MPTAYNYKVKEIIQETPDVKTLVLVPPEGVIFDFEPGQFVMAHLTVPSGAPLSRAYSISSSPREKSSLEITLKIVGAFTRLADQLKSGDELRITGPFGKFVWTERETASNIVMLASGVGVTPFRSMLKYAGETGARGTNFTLLYSNKTASDIIFAAEFAALAERHKRIRVVHTLTREKPSDWRGENRRIDAEMIQKFAPPVEEQLYYLCGRLEFIQAMRKILADLGAPKNNVRFEIF